MQGFPHMAETAGNRSIHMTVGLQVQDYTAEALLQHLAMTGDPGVPPPPPRRYGPCVLSFDVDPGRETA